MSELEAAHLRLSDDPIIAKALEHISLRPPKTEAHVYRALLRSIVGQQLSTKAAATIWGRFQDLFPEDTSAELILKMDIETLRSCGLSYQKSGYIKNIAQFSLENNLSNTHFEKLTDEEALTYLTQIKGVGQWTAEMILMFALNRPDVFPVDDLGIRNAMIGLYGLKSQKRALIQDMLDIAAQWRPYRTYACNLLWDWKDGK